MEGKPLLVQPIDPRDIAQHVGSSSYRVYFFSRETPRSGDPSEAGALVADEYQISDADITAVLEWAIKKARPDQTYVVYLLVDQAGVKTLFRLAGEDLTLTS